MNVIITGRKIELKDAFKEMVRSKMARFDRIFGEDATVHVTVTVEKNSERVELTIHHNGTIYRSEKETLDMHESLDNAIDAMKRQIRKNKSKLERRLRTALIEDYMPSSPDIDASPYKIVRTKKFPVKPLSSEEAILEMNLVGHQFYMFRNCDANEINVVYRRKDGSYGLLEPIVDE